jgi:hypothetical protein
MTACLQLEDTVFSGIQNRALLSQLDMFWHYAPVYEDTSRHICSSHDREDTACIIMCCSSTQEDSVSSWPGASFQNRTYWDCSSLFCIAEDTVPSSWRQAVLISRWISREDEQAKGPLDHESCTWLWFKENSPVRTFHVHTSLVATLDSYNFYSSRFRNPYKPPDVLGVSRERFTESTVSKETYGYIPLRNGSTNVPPKNESETQSRVSKIFSYN